MKIKNALGAALALLLAAACSGKESIPEAASNSGEASVRTGTAWPVLALLQTGDNPLWFELGQEGPELIESPGAASMPPYVPWPHARHITGMQIWDGFLVMAVNRDGFLVLGPAADISGAVLYRVADSVLWDYYTAESFFMWEAKPAILLYRNDFFSVSGAPPLRHQVYVLDKDSPVPLAVSVPALETFPSSGPWEAEVIRHGPDRHWYYRFKEKGKAQSEIAYFSAGDLAAAGEIISLGAWRNSGRPEGPENIPAALAVLLDEAAKLGLEGIPAARSLSPDFEGPRFFSSAGTHAVSESMPLLYAYCRENPAPLALVTLPDGRGLCFYGEEVRPFSLPALNEGFVYTGIALLGNILAAAWEEQQEAGIGAAGFMIITFIMEEDSENP